MIQIKLTPNEEKVLILAYFDMLSDASSIPQHQEIKFLDKLTYSPISKIENLILSKNLERICKHYNSIITKFSVSKPNSAYVKVLGYPFFDPIHGGIKLELLKRLLLIKQSDLTPDIPTDENLLEIKFFYSMQQLNQIFNEKKSITKNQRLSLIFDWYIQWHLLLEIFLHQRGIHLSRIFDEKKFFKAYKTRPNDAYYDYLFNKYNKELSFFINFFDKVFDYKKFFSNYPERRFLLSYLMKTNVCPYCNRQYISVIKGSKRTSATFDHYKREATFPMLKISLYNLIPACYGCNSILKGTANEEHLYPWEDDPVNLKFSYVDSHSPKTNFLKTYYKRFSYDNVYDLTIKIESDPSDSKSQNSLNIFKLEDAYQVHNTYASNLIAKSFKYEQGSYKDDIFNFLSSKDILTDKKKLDELLYGMSFDNNTHNKNDMNTPLYKLTHDLVHKVKENL